MRVGARSRRTNAVWAGACALLAAVALTACSGDDGEVVVRGPDDVRVMTPEEVEAMRSAAQPASESGEAGAAAGAAVPQNEDDRPAEVKMFDAFTVFRDCLAAEGYEFQGDPRQEGNPGAEDPGYMEALTTCAARSNIAEVYAEFQTAADNMTPEQVEERNEGFKQLQECLERRGWTIETSTDEKGLINPTTFVNAQGELDERDIQQCSSELGFEL